MPVFLSQKAHIQYPKGTPGVDAPCHSHSMVKRRNIEDELSGAKPEGTGLCAPQIGVARHLFGVTKLCSSRLVWNTQRLRHGHKRLIRGSLGFNTEDKTIDTYTTVLRFERVHDIALSELRVELIYPADEEGAQFFRESAGISST